MGPIGVPELVMVAGPFVFVGVMGFVLYWIIRADVRAGIRAERQK